jgi:hypothetical protein
MDEKALGTYEMLWDCRFCSTKKLLGLTHRHCPNCGAPQDPSARYFPSDAEKVAVQDHVYAGADRLCPACATPNGAKANCCGNCGSPLDAGKAAAMRKDQVHAEGQAFGGETAAVARAERAGQPAPGALTAGFAPAAPASGGALKGVIVAAVVVLLCGLVFAMCFWKKAVSVAVVSQTWEREIQIEQLAARTESSWCDQLPAGASDVSRSREVRSQKQVKDGEVCATRRKDNGDGTFKQVKECSPKFKNEPVYDDKCSYKVNTWGYERSEKTSGKSIAEPRAWPVVRLTRTGSSVGSEREGTRKATYKVTFSGENGKEGGSCEVDEARWATFTVGSKWQGTASAMTGSLDCGSMKPAK